MNATIEDVMTTTVVAVSQTAHYNEIVTALRRNRVSALPVLDDDRRVIGVVSEADLLDKLAAPPLPTGMIRLAWRLKERIATAVTASEFMSTPAITIAPDETVTDAARLMRTRRLKRLPVVDHDDQLVGIISRADVLSVYDRPDERIRDEVVNAVMARDFGLNPDMFEVKVRSGIVTLIGSIDSRAVALTLLGKIRFLEGVVAVRDRLIYPSED